MTDSIVFVTPDTAVNLAAVQYVKFLQDGCKIVFATDEMITLNAKDSEKFAIWLRKNFPEDVRSTQQTAGFPAPPQRS